MLRAIPLLALLAVGPSAKGPERPLDRLLLRDGRELTGHVVLETGEEVVLANGRKRKVLAREEVSEVVSAWSSAAEYDERHELAEREGHRAWVQLASWCAEVGLEREARLAALRALLTSDDPPGMHTLLGSKAKRDAWSIPWGGSWVELERWRERAAGTRWAAAPELDSSFFRVRSNASALRTLELFGDLHRAYLNWFRGIGNPIGQEQRPELFEVALHGDESSYRGLVGDPPAFFDRHDDRIEIDGLRPENTWLVHHEVAHQLLNDAAEQRRGGGDELPPWLDEGLAEVLARASMAPGGVDFGRSWLRGSHHYATLRRLADPPRLEDVFERRGEEFHGAADPEVAYALAYSLVVLALDERGSEQRAHFFRFLELVLEDRADSDDLARALGRERGGLIEAWHAGIGHGDGESR